MRREWKKKLKMPEKIKGIGDKADCALYHKTIVVRTVISLLKLEPLI